MNETSFEKQILPFQTRPTSMSQSSSALYAAAFQTQIIQHYSNKQTPTNSNRALSTRQVQLLRWSKNLNRTAQKKPTQGDEILLKSNRNTLAEKLGITKTHILSESEWVRVKKTCIDREETNCPICQSAYRLEQQVILSCTHMFHRACFDSFKRLGRFDSCPVCRCDDYQLMTTYHGKQKFIHRCATLIQSVWRGYWQYKKYRQYRENNVPKNSLLRHQFVLRRIEDVGKRLETDMELECNHIKRVIEMMDQTTILANQLVTPRCFSKEWTMIFEKTKKRGGDVTCPICIQSIELPKRVDSKLSRKLYLLNCSHVIHASCLKSLETFNDTKSCPLCRLSYKKKILGK
jgi:hypothetical protein